MQATPDAVHAGIAALGRELGLDPLALDEEGRLALDIGQQLLVQIEAEPEHGSLLLFGVPGALPMPADAALLTRLLQANFAWRATAGATLSLDGEEPPNLVLARRLPWATLSDETVVEAFQALRDQLPELRDWLAGQHAGAASASTAAAQAPASDAHWSDRV